MTPMLDLTWIAGSVHRHQPHGWAMVALVVLFVLFAGIVGACIGDDA